MPTVVGYIRTSPRPAGLNPEAQRDAIQRADYHGWQVKSSLAGCAAIAGATGSITATKATSVARTIARRRLIVRRMHGPWCACHTVRQSTCNGSGVGLSMSQTAKPSVTR
jgi:hypothetical protein